MTEKLNSQDKNVLDVIKLIDQRSATGLSKYGVTTERTDLTREQWLRHLQEELLDASIYIQRLLNDGGWNEPM